MKHLLTIFLSLFILNANTDPVTMYNDWYLIKDTIVKKIKDKKLNIDLFIKDNSLILKHKKDENLIYDFNYVKHDVYLVEENKENIIYIFNHKEKKLVKGKIENKQVNFSEVEWKFNSLMGVIKKCNIKKYASDFSMLERIQNNSFLAKYKYSLRPEEMQCSYFIGGGRCSLAVDPLTDETVDIEMMIINNKLKYAGDLSSIDSVYKDICQFYDKLSTGWFWKD